jgi:predicted metal-dependent peptidase
MLQITTTLSSVARIQKARTALLLDHPFFGTLLFRLGARARSSIATMATDGVSLYFNPEFVETLSSAELIGTLAHETMHPAQHQTRRGSRNPKRWNMACDYAINPLLVDAGLTLPKNVLLDDRFRGMSAERIYNLLEAEEGNEKQNSSDDKSQKDGESQSNTDSKPRESGGEICIAVDCSGSIHDRQLGLFEAEVRSILADQQPRLVHVLYFDTEVHRVETYQAGHPASLNPVGGGGTDFRPCFRWLGEKGIQPRTLVFLTDLCGKFPEEAPPYPVLWASTETRAVPFGQVIPMEAA